MSKPRYNFRYELFFERESYSSILFFNIKFLVIIFVRLYMEIVLVSTMTFCEISFITQGEIINRNKTTHYRKQEQGDDEKERYAVSMLRSAFCFLLLPLRSFFLLHHFFSPLSSTPQHLLRSGGGIRSWCSFMNE